MDSIHPVMVNPANPGVAIPYVASDSPSTESDAPTTESDGPNSESDAPIMTLDANSYAPATLDAPDMGSDSTSDAPTSPFVVVQANVVVPSRVNLGIDYITDSMALPFVTFRNKLRSKHNKRLLTPAFNRFIIDTFVKHTYRLPHGRGLTTNWGPYRDDIRKPSTKTGTNGFHTAVEIFADNVPGSKNQLDMYGKILGLQEIDMKGGASVPMLAVTKSYRGPTQSERWAQKGGGKSKASRRADEDRTDEDNYNNGNGSNRRRDSKSGSVKSSQYPGEKGRPSYFDETVMAPQTSYSYYSSDDDSSSESNSDSDIEMTATRHKPAKPADAKHEFSDAEDEQLMKLAALFPDDKFRFKRIRELVSEPTHTQTHTHLWP